MHYDAHATPVNPADLQEGDTVRCSKDVIFVFNQVLSRRGLRMMRTRPGRYLVVKEVPHG